MRRSVKTAFATVPPEELLLDYVRRLARHRSGRRAVHLRLSRLTRAYRHLEDLRAAEGPFRALLERHEGELVCLRSGDLVCCAKAPRADFDAAALRVLYMMREDRNLRAAIKRGEEDRFLCRWYDLERDYDSLLAFAQAVAADPSHTPEDPPVSIAARTEQQPERKSAATLAAPPQTDTQKRTAPTLPGSAVALPKAALTRPLDADRFAMLERSLESADIARFVKNEPVAYRDDGGEFRSILGRHRIDYEAMGRVVTPGFDLTAEPWFHRRLATVLAKRLLRSDLPAPAPGSTGRLVELTTESVHTEAFDRALRRHGKAGSRHLIATFAATDVFADPDRYLAVVESLRERSLRLAVTGLGASHFAMREDTLIPADYECLSWPALKSMDTEGGAGFEAFMRALRRRDPERVILEACHEPQALAFGRELGIRLFCGPHVTKALERAA